jgi:phage replication O-like protein O
MANPQLEDGRTEFANELVDALCKVNLSAYETRVYWFIARKTYGYHQKTDRIPYTQYEKGTGIDRRHIARAITSLKNKNMITVTGLGYALEYGIQKDYDLWKIDTGLGNKIITSIGNESLPQQATILKTESLPIQGELTPKEATKSLPKEATSKAIKHISKANNILPEWLDRKTWEAFLEMRTAKKAKPTNYAIDLIIRDLAKWREDGEDPQVILEESIKRGWTGVFSLKNKIGGTQNATKSAPDPRKW